MQPLKIRTSALAENLVSNKLKISYSGIRGIVNKGLSPQVALKFGTAFATLIKDISKKEKPAFLICTDTRPSGPALKKAIISGLKTIKCKIIDLGIIPSPTMEIMIKETQSDGGIIITASHNPIQWNGFKFLTGPEGIVLDAKQTETLFKLYQFPEAATLAKTKEQRLPKQESTAINCHINKIISSVNASFIRKKKLKVILDSGKGAGQKISEKLLKNLGCRLISLKIKRDSEPTNKNIKILCRQVVKHKADIGFAQDLDADRLAVVTEKGISIGGEYTLALAVKHLLEKNKNKHAVVVKNSSTSKVIDELVKNYNAELKEVRVGEVNLATALLNLTKSKRTSFGGEGNGGIINPKVTYGRDSLSGIALILEYLSRRNKTVSELVDELPKYYMIKDKIQCFHRQIVDKYLQDIRNKFYKEEISYYDGIKINFSDGSWCQVRPSNTEPIIRIVVEAKTNKRAEEIFKEIKNI